MYYCNQSVNAPKPIIKSVLSDFSKLIAGLVMLILCSCPFIKFSNEFDTNCFSDSVGIMGGLLMILNNALMIVQMGSPTGVGGVCSRLAFCEKESIWLDVNCVKTASRGRPSELHHPPKSNNISI